MCLKGPLNRLLSLSMAILVIAYMLPRTARAGEGLSEFTDIRGHWAEDDIRAAVDARWIDGYPDGTFRPDQTVTRAEFLKMLMGARGISPGEAGIGDDRLKGLHDHNAEGGNATKGRLTITARP